MRDEQRIYDIMVKLQDLWEHYPDQSLGQLLTNYVFTKNDAMFYLEDDEVSQRLTDRLSWIDW